MDLNIQGKQNSVSDYEPYQAAATQVRCRVKGQAIAKICELRGGGLRELDI